jgi:uncharacterized damage-inducible protein DinB
MRTTLLTLVLALGASSALHAQATNPVVASSREIFDRQSKFMIAAAEEMPAEKYSFRPTPAQMSFAGTVAHVVIGNTLVCGMIAGTPATAPAVKDTDTKDTLVAALKTSFDACAKVLATTTDASLGDPISFFGGRKAPRARALLEIDIDVADHYSQMAMYLRLNGLLPPSAQPKK